MSTVATPGNQARPSFGALRVLLIVLGSIFALTGVLAVVGGVAAIVVDQTQRDADGYVSTGATHHSTPTYALVSDSDSLGTAGDWSAVRGMLGTVRIEVSSVTPAFVGIASAQEVDAYLGGVRREQGRTFAASDLVVVGGTAPAVAPARRDIWAARASGAGTQRLTWTPRSGDWRVVLMNADGSKGVDAELSFGARFPHLLAIGIGVTGGGVLLLVISGGVLYATLRRSR